METIKEIQKGGFTAKIYQDELAESPAQCGDTDCFLVYDHRQFNVEQKGFDPTDIFEHIERTNRFFYQGYWVFPVYAYIHSGVSLSLGKTSYPFTCPWDTSMRGFALVKRQKGWTYTKEQGQKVADSVVSEWNQYLSGDVYYYQVEDSQGETVDSCGGFYGIEHVESEATAIIDYHIGKLFQRRIDQVKTFIRNRVPFEVRQKQLSHE